MNGEDAGMQLMTQLKSRRWQDGDCSDAEAAANDRVFAMRRKG